MEMRFARRIFALKTVLGTHRQALRITQCKHPNTFYFQHSLNNHPRRKFLITNLLSSNI